MEDYGNMEKVGDLGQQLERNDKHITTQPGDVILYQGHFLVIYYRPNTWNFTKIGEVIDLDATELRTALGQGDMTVTLTLVE